MYLFFLQTYCYNRVSLGVCHFCGDPVRAWKTVVYLIAVFPLTFVLLSGIRRGGKAGGG
jgi:hypothetical protein